jgi:hypothetical protein
MAATSAYTTKGKITTKNNKMKNKSIFLTCALVTGTVLAQKDINLSITHEFDGAPFAYNTNYTADDGKTISFDRVQYYLSGFELTHDGAQVTTLPDAYVLGSGNVSAYSLGTANITTLEALTFDLGLSYATNHMGTTNWAANHPLASQSPSMDWGWPSGYFFFVINGMVDDNGDGTPNKAFEMKGMGDALFRNVNTITGVNLSGITIDINMFANVADWTRNVNLVTVGYDHSASSNNTFVANNTNTEEVFTMNSELSLEKKGHIKSNIHADYSLAYAPTLVYQLKTTKKVNLKIYDTNGQLVLESDNLAKEGNFFVNKELNTGTYFAVFSNDDISEKFKFIVSK